MAGIVNLVEITTVGPDVIVVHERTSEGTVVHRREGLLPATTYDVAGRSVATLARPAGELLCRFATVNDTHFGEEEIRTEWGGQEIGTRMRRPAGTTPHPVLCNRGAIAEINAIDPLAVVAKGDLTTHGTTTEYQQFLDHYAAAFPDRLHHIRGNHECYSGEVHAAHGPFRVTLPGVTLAVLDTVRYGDDGGSLSAQTIEWLDTVGAESDTPVLVFGHHHCWNPVAPELATADSGAPEPEATARRPRVRPGLDYFGIDPDSSEAMIAMFARRPTLRGYFAGHTHRNRVRRFPWVTGDRPFAEISCVKDFPGVWAEYQVYEGGIVQLVHRISDPEVLSWTDQTRELLPENAYVNYAFGALSDRCFIV